MAIERQSKSSEFRNNKKTFYKGDKYLEFDVKENSKRLKKQQNGDEAFYYLSLYSFIEGYIRQRLPNIYSFDKSKVCLYDIFEDLITLFSNATNENNIKMLKQGQFAIEKTYFDKIAQTQRTNSYKTKITDLFYSDKEITVESINAILENLKTLQDFGGISYLQTTSVTGKELKELFISTDRVRHNFSNQKPENLKISINQFCDFAQNFGFINEEIESLRANEDIFSDEINREKPADNSDSVTLIEENKKLSAKLEAIKAKYSKSVEENINFQNKINELTARLENNENIYEDSSVNDDFKIYLAQKEQLALNLNLLTHYSKSWRNYQVIMAILTEQQKDIINDIHTSIKEKKKQNYLIQGGPGTGKTIILINLLQLLANKDIMLLTYTSSLNKYNKYIAENVAFKNSTRATSDVTHKIETFDKFITSKAEKILQREIFLPSAENDYNDIYSKQIKQIIVNNIDKTNAGYIYSEALNEIWSLAPAKEDYIDHSYSYGKENAIKDIEEIKRRTKTWEYVKELEKLLNKPGQKVLPLEYACYLLSLSNEILPEYRIFYNLENGIKDEYKIDYLLIDEIQDLSNAKIRTISNITRENYVLTGDLAQSVFIRKGLTWNEVIDLMNNNEQNISFSSLTKNFRSTFAIQDLANNFRLKEDFRIKDEDVLSEGFMPGANPDYSILDTIDESIDAIKNRIKLLKEKLFFSYKDFCIVVPGAPEISRLKKSFENDLPIMEMENSDFKPELDCVRLSTIKYVKGIDSPVVILLLTRNYLNQGINGNLDENSQMNGIYACITRAMNILSVFISNDNNFLQIEKDSSISKFIQVLEKDAVNYQL